MIYAGSGFGAVLRGEVAAASAATTAAAAAATATARRYVQRLKSLQFGDYGAVLRCGGGGQGLFYYVAAGGRRGQGGEVCIKLRHE